MADKKNTSSSYVKKTTKKEFDSYSDHPRFGKYPHFTGQNPHNDFAGGIHLHWHSTPESRIPNTAIAADIARQHPSMYPVTHYYDEKRICTVCDKSFIFFAQEQKYWYEDLKFPLEVACTRCVYCRKKTQWIARNKARYDELFHKNDKSADEALEMASCCLSLIEEGYFTKKQEKQVRTLIKSVNMQHTQRYAELLKRLDALKASEVASVEDDRSQ